MSDERREIGEMGKIKEIDGMEEWRRLYRRHLAGAPSPDEEDLVELVAGELGGEERARLADRVVASRRGTDDYLLLKELDREARPARRPPLTARRHRRLARFAATAAVLIMVAGLLVLLGDFTAPSDETEGQSPTLRRGTAPNATVEPADGAELEAAPRRLQWPSQPGATAYRVEIRDARAELVWRSPEIDPATTRLDLPPPARQELRAGEAYFWVVRVDGGARPALGPHWFHLAERRP